MNKKGERTPATGSSLASVFLGGSEPHVSETQGGWPGCPGRRCQLSRSPADSGHALPPWLPSDTPPWLWEPGQPAASIPQHSLSLQGRRQLQACLPGTAAPSAPPCRQRWSRAAGRSGTVRAAAQVQAACPSPQANQTQPGGASRPSPASSWTSRKLQLLNN